MTDREEFNAWVDACPVTVSRLDFAAHGYVEVHVQINDEQDDDDRFEDARHQAQWKIDKRRPADYWTR